MRNIILLLTLFICILSQSCNKESAEIKSDTFPNGTLFPGIALTFDDIWVQEWIEMLPILKKYNAHGTFFISFNKNPRPNSDSIQILFKAGNEIGSHTWTHEDVLEYTKTHSLEEYYKNQILPTLERFQSLEIPCTSFSYPNGNRTPASDRYLAKYFKKIRGGWNNKTTASFIVTKGEVIVEHKFCLDFVNDSSLITIKDQILKAKMHNAVLVLVGHKPSNISRKDPYPTFSLSILDSICNFVHKQNMRFYNLNEL